MANILIVITSILIGIVLQKVRNFPIEAPNLPSLGFSSVIWANVLVGTKKPLAV